jgi:NAD(P)-dependent dehydrogenase (short-subunit alcohol dehydrogenase family)
VETDLNFQDKTIVVANVVSSAGSRTTQAHIRYGEHIGAVCATSFALEGANVVAIDPDKEALERIGEKARTHGRTITLIEADVTDTADLERAAKQCADRFGMIHTLLNCHFDTELASIEDSSPESWARVVRCNLLGPVFTTKAFLPLLKLAKGAAVVHVGSIDGTLGNPQIPSYSASKGGLVPLTHVMAEEFARFGIRVNCIARGMMTREGDKIAPMWIPLIAQTPLARPAYPHEVVNAIRFLASSDASYVNGVILPVDGGRTGITQGTRPQH